MRALGRDNSVIPRIAFQSALALINKAQWFARPRFRDCDSLPLKHNKAGFCPYTLRRISKPAEPTIGLRRYLFDGVPPQPNCPFAGVTSFEDKQHKSHWVVFHWCLFIAWRLWRKRLPLTLHNETCVAAANCSKVPWGLRFPLGLSSLCAGMKFSVGANRGQ